MSKIDFSERVAIVTGAGAGLGRDYAIQLAQRGAKVVVNDLGGALNGTGSSESAANKVVDEIKAQGGEAVPNYDSVATAEGGENIIKTAVENYGRVDILVNNAGILRDGTFVKMEEENWDAVVDVHLKGAYCVSRPAMAQMRENGYGRIVMTASGSGLFGNFGQTNYAAAKMGLAGMINVLKLEGAKYNIKVNAIVPSAATRMTKDVMPPEIAENLKVERITPAVLYMCSEQCQESGLYINAFGGYFSRSNMVTGPGTVIRGVTTPEQIMENWDKITSLEKAYFSNDLNEMSMKAFQALMAK